MRPKPNSGGYLHVLLTKDKNRKTFSIHRLVAKAFIVNPENLPEIDHINRDRADNRVENLRWVSAAEQQSNRRPKSKNSEETKLRVLCVETDEKFENSAAAAQWILGQNLSNSRIGDIAKQIRKVCNHDYGCKSAYGYHWEFVEED